MRKECLVQLHLAPDEVKTTPGPAAQKGEEAKQDASTGSTKPLTAAKLLDDGTWPKKSWRMPSPKKTKQPNSRTVS